MHLHVLGSSSYGNCYLLENEQTALIIECGINIQEVKQALNFNVSKVVGALISHSHGDHSKYASHFMRAGINVYCLQDTSTSLGLTGHRLHNIIPEKLFHVGEFKILPFEVEHDVPAVGFLINHNECGNVLFLTDTAYSKYTFKNLNNIILETNYDTEIVRKRVFENTIINQVRDRVIESHLSIETALQLLKANDLSHVNNIVCLHLSDGNSDSASFKKRIEQATGKQVHIAEKGLQINFNVTPF